MNYNKKEYKRRLLFRVETYILADHHMVVMQMKMM
jgi:hypothetical protein